MDGNIKNVSLEEQLHLAQLLLHHYGTFHPFLELQLEKYTVACCNIALPGTVKLDFGGKIVTFEIRTEKKYKKIKDQVVPNKKSKITKRKYESEISTAKRNLEDWTKKLLWGEATTVRIYVDGSEV